MVSTKQAKNIAKHLRIARSTTGAESDKHYDIVNKLVERYGIIIPDFENDTHVGVIKTTEEKKKVFYNYFEWSGWRFYLKAIRHGDWSSIKQHIMDVYFR